MNWNVDVREGDNASTGGVAIVIHKSWDCDLIKRTMGMQYVY
jgi:hypothetical protein